MPDEARVAVAALCGIGCDIHDRTTSASRRWHVDLNRSQDVGSIDLQHAAPGPAHLYQNFGHALNHCVPASLARARVYIPTPTYRALVLITHDQFQDYGYWLGDLDLRHLVELRDLNDSAEGLDWRELTSLVSGELMKNAVESQLVALAELLGVEIPHALRCRLIPRLQFMRQLMQSRFPATRVPLLAMNVLDLRNYGERRSPATRKPGCAARIVIHAKSGHLTVLVEGSHRSSCRKGLNPVTVRREVWRSWRQISCTFAVRNPAKSAYRSGIRRAKTFRTA